MGDDAKAGEEVGILLPIDAFMQGGTSRNRCGRHLHPYLPHRLREVLRGTTNGKVFRNRCGRYDCSSNLLVRRIA